VSWIERAIDPPTVGAAEMTIPGRARGAIAPAAPDLVQGPTGHRLAAG